MSVPGSKVPTAESIAAWMFEQFKVSQYWLAQRRIAWNIRARFGEEFVHKNGNRNWAIRKDILDVFRELTGEAAVWSRSRQAWRKRKPSDEPGVRMVA